MRQVTSKNGWAPGQRMYGYAVSQGAGLVVFVAVTLSGGKRAGQQGACVAKLTGVEDKGSSK